RGEAFREQYRVAERGLAVVRERVAAVAEQRTSAEADVVRHEGALERLAQDEAEAARATSPEGEDALEESARLDELQARLARERGGLGAVQTERASGVEQVQRTDAAVQEAEGRLARTTQHVHSLESNLAVDQARQLDRESRLSSLQQQLASAAQEHIDVEA